MLRPHDRIDKYEIRERIATGGMGTLYLAHDTTLDRTVALKLFHGDLDRPNAREDFQREARAIAALNNPNIVTIYDSGEHLSQPFLVMEYVRGETLAEFIRRARPDVPVLSRLAWMEELSAAVAAAHARGIIHRDIKPANLMIDAYGRLKVLDFGIARMRGSITSRSTARIATPGYVAPEQIRGGEVDARSDIFSIGVVCYELFTYAEAFGGETEHATTHRALHEDPVPIEQCDPTIDADLAAVVRQAMRRDAAERFQTADLMREALTAVRRRLEATASETIVGRYLPTAPSSAPTVMLPRSLSEHRPRPDTGAGASKPASPRRTTKEVLERQLQEWIALANSHLAAADLTEARAACAEALRLLPDHADALRLSKQIESAGADHTILAPPPVDGGLTGVGEAFDKTRLFVRPAAGAALADVRTGPLDFTAQSSAETHLGPAPVVGVAERTAHAAEATLPPAAPAERPPASRVAAPSRRSPWLLAGIAMAVLAAIGAAWALTRTPAVIVRQSVLIDALPWGTVKAVRGADGHAEVLPADASTPLSLALPPGQYQVTLVGPPPASVSRQIPLVIAEQGAPKPIVERFDGLTADQYFTQFVTPASPAVPPPTEKQEPQP